ncbi:unnamed protein product [Effrenium voratum]|nr:unnamed protein product [Effrenium voratum]
MQASVAACSFYFFSLEDAGFVAKDATSAEVVPQTYLELGRTACSLSELELSNFPGGQERAKWLCADLVYVFVLLTVGFGIQANSSILAMKELTSPRGLNYTASWTLGLALQLAHVRNRRL